MKRLPILCLALGLGACVTPGPPVAHNPSSGAPVMLSGPACITTYVRSGTPLALDLARLPYPIVCGTGPDDSGRTMDLVNAGFARTPGTGSYPDPAAPVALAFMRFHDRSRQPMPPGGFAERIASLPRVRALETLDLPAQITVDGSKVTVVGLAFSVDGWPERFACVAATSSADDGWGATICRQPGASGAAATARAIIAEDLPALIFHPAAGTP